MTTFYIAASSFAAGAVVSALYFTALERAVARILARAAVRMDCASLPK